MENGISFYRKKERKKSCVFNFTIFSDHVELVYTHFILIYIKKKGEKFYLQLETRIRICCAAVLREEKRKKKIIITVNVAFAYEFSIKSTFQKRKIHKHNTIKLS